MQITKQEIEPMVRIIMRKRKIPRARAIKIVQEHNSYLKDLTKKKRIERIMLRKEKERDLTKNFSKHFREMKKRRK